MALTTSLVVVAFLTNAVVVLPLIALLLVVTSASVAPGKTLDKRAEPRSKSASPGIRN
jgi:hypothetical protein